MTAVPLTYVHGDHLHQETSPSLLTFDKISLQPSDIKERYPDLSITSIELIPRLNQTAYLVNTKDSPLLINTTNGQVIPPLSEAQAIEIATNSHTGDVSVVNARLITSYSEAPEIKGRPLPIWQVNFDDWSKSTLYVSNINAKVITARSSIWRIFDFLWMLHIMDYDEREDFNNPLVIFMASLALFLVLSGSIMIGKGLNGRGMRYLK